MCNLKDKILTEWECEGKKKMTSHSLFKFQTQEPRTGATTAQDDDKKLGRKVSRNSWFSIINKFHINWNHLAIRASKTTENLCSKLLADFLLWLTLQPWRWIRYIQPKCRLTFTELQGVISHKTEFFIITLWEPEEPEEATVVSLNEKTVSRADNPLGFLSYFAFHARRTVWDQPAVFLRMLAAVSFPCSFDGWKNVCSILWQVHNSSLFLYSAPSDGFLGGAQSHNLNTSHCSSGSVQRCGSCLAICNRKEVTKYVSEFHLPAVRNLGWTV
jgi:hypothetical protein